MTAPEVRTPGGNQADAEYIEADIAIVGQVAAARKGFASAAAKAAQAGCTLHEVASGGYLLGRWNMCRELPDERALHALLAQMTGAQR